MAPRTQSLAHAIVRSFFARAIGEAVYRADRNDVTAHLAQVGSTAQREYEETGTFVMRLADSDELRAGLYAGADALVAGGIGSLNLRQRTAAVAMFARAFVAMKKQMNGTSAPDTAELMRALAEADDAAGINAQPVNMKPSTDLASIDTALEVH
jgi:hypothetical protein